MNALLKLLIAAACICVITVSAHYGYTTYQAHLQAEAAAERVKADIQRILKEEDEKKDADRARRKVEREQKRKAFLERVEARKAERAAKELKKQQAGN